MTILPRRAASAARRAWFALNRPAFSDRQGTRKPRLLVDVSVISRNDAATGIQRVVRAIWSELCRIPPAEFEVVPVFAGRAHGYCFADVDFLQRKRPARRVPVGVRPGDKFLGLDLAAHYLPDCLPQLNAWREAGATVHLVVYDLLPLTRTEWFNPATAAHFSRWFEVLRTSADQALCISDQVKQELLERLDGRPGPHVGRLHLSGDMAGSRPSRGVTAEAHDVLRRIAERPTILMVGTIEPRKGYNPALDAFDQLWRDDLSTAPNLVILGRAGWKTEALQQRLRGHPLRDERLHWLENASDETVSLFYQQCTGLLFASRAEGFGLPLAEAAMHRRWILARDLPVFVEQGLPNVLYFSSDDPRSLADRLRDLIATAAKSPPPCSDLPSWSWCVETLVEEIGLAPAPVTARRPVAAATP